MFLKKFLLVFCHILIKSSKNKLLLTIFIWLFFTTMSIFNKTTPSLFIQKLNSSSVSICYDIHEETALQNEFWWHWEHSLEQDSFCIFMTTMKNYQNLLFFHWKVNQEWTLKRLFFSSLWKAWVSGTCQAKNITKFYLYFNFLFFPNTMLPELDSQTTYSRGDIY